ncbi:MAG: RsmG family class I SAM-dependent methyltransferase [Thermoanaerobaculia bacterium]|nr:RsmG family class I SAM-dependent methyltransferase [Thermoanaerobaculia bacterium]
MNSDEKHARYEELLRTWSARVNLIGPEARQNLEAHIDEARHTAEILRPAGRCLDFGSGGGLPAIPIAIDFPEASFWLVEADQKKWAFLKHVARECALNVRVLGDRLERLLDENRLEGPFQLVTSRAVGRPEAWIPTLAGVLAPGARIAIFERTQEPPQIDGFSTDEIVPLRRGADNYLITLQQESRVQR